MLSCFQVYVDCGREIVGEEDVPLIQLLHDMPWCLKFVVASDTDILSRCFSGCKKKILHWFALLPYSFKEIFLSCFNLNKLVFLCSLACRFCIDTSKICMVGDRLDTDVLFGNNAGCKTLLVLSGSSLTSASIHSLVHLICCNKTEIIKCINQVLLTFLLWCVRCD